MRNKLLILIVVGIGIVGAILVFQNKPADTEQKTGSMMKEEEEMMEDEKMEKDDAMTEKDDSMMKDESPMVKFQGQVLAGTSATLLDFNEADYRVALASDKLVVVYFYANWCPICRVEFPKMQEAFNTLATDEVVGFRVNYNDSDTDDREKELAREHGVAYQHTKVFIKNGERVLKSPESWDKLRYIEEVNNNL